MIGQVNQKPTSTSVIMSTGKTLEESLGSMGGGKLLYLENTATVSTSVNQVLIGISGFVPSEDKILVFKNNTLLYQDIDYTINTSTSSVVKKEGNWGENGLTDYFYFLVIKSVSVTAPVYDGTFIKDTSISKTKLDTSLQTEITGATSHKTSVEIHRKITFGTTDPTGGVDGDIYFQYT